MTPNLRFQECAICCAQLDYIRLTINHHMPPANAAAYTMNLTTVPGD